MDCPSKSINRKGGFTLIEVLVVITVLGLLISISTVGFTNFRTHESLRIALSGVVEATRRAQVSAIEAKGDSEWGVFFQSDRVVVFKGSSYASRDNSYDQTLVVPGGVVISGLSEVVFDKLRGTTTNIGIITLTNSYGTSNITINDKGTLSY